MAHAVAVLSADRVGDTVTVAGTVDGAPATVQVWWSHLLSLPDNAARKQYAAQQLVFQVAQSTPVPITGTTTV
jgi:hypothetical protein